MYVHITELKTEHELTVNFDIVLSIEQHTDSEDKGILIHFKVVEAQMISYLTCLGLENDEILKISGVLESLQPVFQYT